MILPNVVNLWINQGRNERQKQEQRIEMRLFVFMKSKCKSSALLCRTKCLLDFVRCPFYVILLRHFKHIPRKLTGAMDTINHNLTGTII